MYVEFMKNFLLGDSIELLAATVIFVILSQKTFDSYFLDIMYVEFVKNFLLGDSIELLAARLIFVILSPKRFDSYFLDMIYVEIHEKFSSRPFERAGGC